MSYKYSVYGRKELEMESEFKTVIIEAAEGNLGYGTQIRKNELGDSRVGF